jgi:hypothetical protein
MWLKESDMEEGGERLLKWDMRSALFVQIPISLVLGF